LVANRWLLINGRWQNCQKTTADRNVRATPTPFILMQGCDVIYLPTTLFDVVHNLLALLSVALLLVAIGTLLWFFYWFFLRRLLRARRIANARFKRMMDDR
jgi:hypothetical protein